MSNLGLFGFGPDGWGAVLLAGAAVSICAAVCGLILASLIGAAAARAKLLGGPVARTIAHTYTTVLRGVPDLLLGRQQGDDLRQEAPRQALSASSRAGRR